MMQSEVVEEIIYGLESGILFGYLGFQLLKQQIMMTSETCIDNIRKLLSLGKRIWKERNLNGHMHRGPSMGATSESKTVCGEGSKFNDLNQMVKRQKDKPRAR
ncbi:hypothetical protein LOK49_LG10G00700 [Camellia lanceoleosa]|uniref:Uncharacterized protein n=1 Tax=Camellia lanceoleosa TaxID=1840588 RepID=A0ACC0GEE1_9ERIC|nr:hypothetical protein LOK49_LG10G00700 [Camellia lanceoleosa]